MLTTSVSDDKGDPALRSPFLDDALRLVPEGPLDGADRSPGDVRPAPGETFGADDLERTALAALTERFEPGTASERRAKTGLALFARLAKEPANYGALADAARWFRADEASLAPRGEAKKALALPRRRSASQLSNFAQCAYRHFADKGLGLSEADPGADDGPNALILGSIAHEVLERALAYPTRAESIFEDVWRRHAGHFAPSLRLARDRAGLKRTLLERIGAWAREPLVPGFAPLALELAFGLEGAAPLVVGPADGGVEVAGKIDRVDADAAGRAVVIDYKLSVVSRYAGLADKIASGTDLQLPIYVLAAERLLEKPVVAAGYATLRDGGERWLRLAADAPGGSKADVTWEGEARAAGLAAVEARIRAHDAAIRTGRIVALPTDPDRCGSGRCPFADLCRYEGGA